MLNKALEFVIGDIAGKKEYRQLEKRINQLPKEYNVAFKKIRKYMYTVSAPNGDMEVFNDLTIFVNMLELFEEAVAQGKRVNCIMQVKSTSCCELKIQSLSEKINLRSRKCVF